METQRRLAGMANNKPKPYIDAGMLLVDKLMAFLDLSGWKDGHPMYTHSEIESINRKTSGFQKLATEEMGAENHFHPTLFQDLRRTLTAEALFELAGNKWKFSKQVPREWRNCAATYLKAWFLKHNPMTLLELGDLFLKAGYKKEAKETYKVVLLFPTYVNIYYSGNRKPKSVKRIVKHAKKSLRKLQ